MVTKLFDERQIEQRVHALAAELAEVLPPEPTVVGILKGSFIFVADLVRALDHAGLKPRVEFIRLRSYGEARERSKLQQVGPIPSHPLGSVLLVDDIADTGWSLHTATGLLKPVASEIRTCALIDKAGRREVDFTPDFVGFNVEDRFVVGYGLDDAEAYRHLPWIGAVT